MQGLPDLKKFFEWLKDPNNKTVSQLVFIFTLGLFLLLMSKIVLQPQVKDKPSTSKSVLAENKIEVQENFEDDQVYKVKLEKQLTSVLGKVKDVGEVTVMITLENETQIEPAFNIVSNEKTTQEKDTGGGIRTVTEIQSNQQAVLVRKSGEDEPLVLKQITPQIKGILIVAKGASSSETVEKIVKATSTLLDIPLYKIKVLEQ